MSDEIERLKQALLTDRPTARPEARRAALDVALRSFDENISAAAQGSAVEARPNSSRTERSGAMFGRSLMSKFRRNLLPVLAGGAVVGGAVGLAAMLVVRQPDFLDLDASKPDAAQVGGSVRAMKVARADADDGTKLADEERLAREQAPPAAKPAPDILSFDGGGPVGRLRGAESEFNTKENLRERTETEIVTGKAAGRGAASMAPPPAPSVVGPMGAVADNRSAAAPGVSGGLAGELAAGDGFGVVVASEPAPADQVAARGYEDQGRDKFEEVVVNPLKVTAEEPVSTFSIDVDTASYGFMRRQIDSGVLPQKNAVRIEELVNYFPYDYPAPESRETPFRADVAVMPTPWNARTKLMRIGIRGYALQQAEKPRSNLVFLIDTSGSMDAPDKLPLLLNAFRLLVEGLKPEDTVAIVVYAGSAGTVLEPTPVSQKAKILRSLEQLQAGGSTAGAEGIRQAYALAEQALDPNGVNRVILATDGDFNVGVTDPEELKSFIERKRDSGVFLSVLGFGQGNYNDALMQTLAQNGNGQAAYIDTLNEARKVLVEEAASTLFPIAKDVKIQVEFNPATVAEYRLIGYETRLLRREDFNNDKIDAGEIGAGHTVTALYEITPVDSNARMVDALRYPPAGGGAAPQNAARQGAGGEYGFLKIRYKLPEEDTSRLISTPVTPELELDPASDAAREARFAAAVAGFGQLLRGGAFTGGFTYDDVIALAEGAKGPDRFGYRAEFVTLARLAKSAAAMERQK